MARLIVKSSYVTSGAGGGSSGGYPKHIGTREGVELLHTYEQKSSSRDELVCRARGEGQKTYGYFPKGVEKIADEVVDQMEQLPVINECYQTWWEFLCQVEDFHSVKKRQSPPLSQQMEFRSIKNAVIQEAENIRMCTVTFEGADMDASTEFFDLPYNCWELWMVFSYIMRLLKILPVDWTHSIPFGLLHSPTPSPTVKTLMDAIAQVMGEQ